MNAALPGGAVADQLIDNYLHELRVSAWNQRLSAADTDALEIEVRAGIDASLNAEGTRTKATVYRVLDRLGPASDIVTRKLAAPRSSARQRLDTALAPLVRMRTILRQYGWGAAEIVGLLLLILAPFYFWWIGPIFGIILVRLAANRWSHHATHIATVVVVVLFAVQVVIGLGLVAIVLSGGLQSENFQRVFSIFAPSAIFHGAGLTPPTGTIPAPESISLMEIAVILPAPLAGVVAGVYLALSPRHRPA